MLFYSLTTSVRFPRLDFDGIRMLSTMTYEQFCAEENIQGGDIEKGEELYDNYMDKRHNNFIKEQIEFWKNRLEKSINDKVDSSKEDLWIIASSTNSRKHRLLRFFKNYPKILRAENIKLDFVCTVEKENLYGATSLSSLIEDCKYHIDKLKSFYVEKISSVSYFLTVSGICVGIIGLAFAILSFHRGVVNERDTKVSNKSFNQRIDSLTTKVETNELKNSEILKHEQKQLGLTDSVIKQGNKNVFFLKQRLDKLYVDVDALHSNVNALNSNVDFLNSNVDSNRIKSLEILEKEIIQLGLTNSVRKQGENNEKHLDSIAYHQRCISENTKYIKDHVEHNGVDSSDNKSKRSKPNALIGQDGRLKNWLLSHNKPETASGW